jgi:hypothetical protein
VDPLGLRSTDLEFQNCLLNKDNQCPVVIDDVSDSFRAGHEAYGREIAGYECPRAPDYAAEMVSVSNTLGLDTRLLFGIYGQEATGCRRPNHDLALAGVGRLGSAGIANLPRSSFENTVRRNPTRFGFSSSDEITDEWLYEQFKVLPAITGDSPYNLAYATASRLLDILSDLGSAMTQRNVMSIGRAKGKTLADDSRFRVYRESALVGQAYNSVRNDAERFFIDLFTLGDEGFIDAEGSAVHIDKYGSNGYSNAFDATCSTYPFQC